LGGRLDRVAHQVGERDRPATRVVASPTVTRMPSAPIDRSCAIMAGDTNPVHANALLAERYRDAAGANTQFQGCARPARSAKLTGSTGAGSNRFAHLVSHVLAICSPK
jgi:hypothetical protein